ncbi:MAG: hypothetical protein LJE84_10385 [Gammaproteobacteria bacterium]|nr:hypothetical protein [Gammaproteobacteria bacterium]
MTRGARGLLWLGLVASLAMPAQARQAPGAGPPPSIGNAAWNLRDYASGWTLAEREAGEKTRCGFFELASLGAIFRELEARRLNLDDLVRIPETLAGREPYFFRARARVPLQELLRAQVAAPSPEIADLLAEHVAGGREAFTTLVRRYLVERGFQGLGWDAVGPRGTLKDLTALANDLVRTFPDYYGWFSSRQVTVNGITRYSSNRLLWQNPFVDGLLTANSGATRCLILSAKRDGMRATVALAVTDDEFGPDDAADRLLGYAFSSFSSHRVYRAGDPLLEVGVWMGEQPRVALGLARDVDVVLPRGTVDRLQANLNLSESHQAPLTAGQKLGSLTLLYGEEVVGDYPLVALQAVPVGSWYRQMLDRFRLWIRKD